LVSPAALLHAAAIGMRTHPLPIILGAIDNWFIASVRRGERHVPPATLSWPDASNAQGRVHEGDTVYQ
jgi:hypothetical protein